MAKTRGIEIATCVRPTEMVRALRELVVGSGWAYERIEGLQTVDRFAIIMPLTHLAKSIGIKVLDGPFAGTELQAWSHTPGSGGSVHFTSWWVPTSVELEHLDLLITHWAAALPRIPWRWTFAERSMIGYFHPVFRRSRHIFTGLGFDTRSKRWPIDLDSQLPSSPEEE